MLTFFRKIRRSLLESGRFKSYVLYALGEIALVVIGILIALQINDWNLQRLNSNEEERILQGISQKLEFNRFQHSMGSSRYEEVIKAAERLLVGTTSDEPLTNWEEIAGDLHSLTKRFLMGANNATHIYDELIGSGQLGLISSYDLRERITTMKVNLELLASYEVLQTRFVDNQLSPYLNKHVDRLAIHGIGATSDSSWYDEVLNRHGTIKDHPGDDLSFEIILQDQEFANLLVELVQKTRVLLPIYERIENHLIGINALINSK